MNTPLNISAEWGSLTRTHDRERNLESIRALQAWLAGVEDYLRNGGDPGAEPKIYGHGGTNVRGFTSTEFDGVATAKLRYWLEWWEHPQRTPHGAEEGGREPAAEAAKVRREIEAREAAGKAGGG